MSDPDAGVRTGAMRTLAVLRGEHAAKLALERLDDPDSHVRATAVASLLAADDGDAGKRAEAVLAELAGDDDPVVRADTVAALGQVADPIAADVIVAMLY